MKLHKKAIFEFLLIGITIYILMLLSQSVLKQALTSVFIYTNFKSFISIITAISSSYLTIIFISILEFLLISALGQVNIDLKTSKIKELKRILNWLNFRIFYVTIPFLKYTGISLLTLTFFAYLLNLNILKAPTNITVFVILFSTIFSLSLSLFGAINSFWNFASTELGAINCVLSPTLTNKEITKRSQKLLYQKPKYIFLFLTNTCIFSAIFLGLYKHHSFLSIIFLTYFVFTFSIKKYIFIKSLKSYNQNLLTITPQMVCQKTDLNNF